MIKRQTIAFISVLLLLLVFWVNLSEPPRTQSVIHLDNNSATPEVKEDFRIDDVGSMIFPNHPLLGWVVVFLGIAVFVIILDRIRKRRR